MAAVFEAAQLQGMGRRVLALCGGERHMTDLAHIAQLLHDTAHRERSACRRCGIGCELNATTAEVRPNTTAVWTPTPTPCRS